VAARKGEKRKGRKTKYSGNGIYSAEWENYEQTTVTLKKPQKTTQGMMNSGSLIYLENPIHITTQKRENLHRKKGKPSGLSD